MIGFIKVYHKQLVLGLAILFFMLDSKLKLTQPKEYAIIRGSEGLQKMKSFIWVTVYM